MVPRRFVRLAIVDAVGRVHAHLAPPGLEDQPTRASARRILDVGPAEDVAKECARCGGIVGINQGVDAGDHQTELLKSLRIVFNYVERAAANGACGTEDGNAFHG